MEGGGGVLGHVLHRPPEGPQRSGAASAHGAAVKQDLAGVLRARGVEQQQGTQQRRLAASRASDEGHVLPRLQAQVHAAQHLSPLAARPRVGAPEATGLKSAHAAAPAAARAPSMVSSAPASHMAAVTGCSGRVRTERVCPDSMMAPSWRTAMFSQMAAAGRSWVMRSRAGAWGRLVRELRSPRISARATTSRAVVGSSAMMRAGSAARARARLTRWRWPPERRPGTRSAKDSSSPTA